MNATVKTVPPNTVQRVRQGAEDLKKKVRGDLPQLIKDNQLSLMLMAAGLAAVLVVMMIWSSNGDLRPLFGRQEMYDTAAVLESLDSAQIDYQIHPESGQVLVARENMSRARMQLATAGIQAKSPAGMELLSSEGQLGRSQFVESVQYREGLQGEISQTITSLRQVRSARVHLAVPERTAFLRDQAEPSASVYVDLYPGATLDNRQVQGIINLVAGSLPQLKAENITVLDQNSNPLNSDMDTGNEEADRQLEYIQKIERQFVRRLSALLEPVVGPGNLRVAVNARVDFSYQENSREGFDPDNSVLRSESFSGTGQDNTRTLASGVPGVVANTTPNAAQPDAEPESSVSRIRNYEMGRTLSFQRQDAFRLEQVNVAVILNRNVAGLDGEGAELTLEAVNSLLSNAAGIDVNRGDRVTVQALPFFDVRQEINLATEGGVFESNSTQLMVFAIIGLIVVIVITILVVYLVRRRRDKRNKQEIEQELAMLDANGDIHDARDGDLAASEFRSADRVRDLAKSSPEQIAGILERWMKEGD